MSRRSALLGEEWKWGRVIWAIPAILGTLGPALAQADHQAPGNAPSGQSGPSVSAPAVTGTRQPSPGLMPRTSQSSGLTPETSATSRIPSAAPSHTTDWILAAILLLVVFGYLHHRHRQSRRERSSPSP